MDSGFRRNDGEGEAGRRFQSARLREAAIEPLAERPLLTPHRNFAIILSCILYQAAFKFKAI